MNLRIVRIPFHFRALEKSPFQVEIRLSSHKEREEKEQEMKCTVLPACILHQIVQRLDY